MIDGLDKLAEIEVLREAAQRPPAEVQRMQMPSPQAGLQSLGQQEVDMGTGMPVGFSPADAVGQVTNIAGQYAMANPQKTGPFAAALAAFGAGSEAANMIDKRVEVESERENLDVVKNVVTSLPDRTRTNMPAMAMPMDRPVQAQEEIQVSEVAPQSEVTLKEGLSSIIPMSKGGAMKRTVQGIAGEENNAIFQNELKRIKADRNISPAVKRLIPFWTEQEGFLNKTKGAVEGGATKDIGFGHKLTNAERKSKKVYGIDISKPLSIRDALTISVRDLEEGLTQVKNNIPTDSKLKTDELATLLDIQKNVSGGIATYPMFTKGILTNNKDLINEHYKRYYRKNGKKIPLGRRNEAFVKEFSSVFKPSFNKTKNDLEELASLEKTALETPKVYDQYVVKKGDNLTKIANRLGITLEELRNVNKDITLANQDNINIDDKINIPIMQDNTFNRNISEQPQDQSILDNIKSYGGKAIEFLGLQEGGDVGEYFEGQVEGKGDGMSDEIPFRVEGGNPDFALLSKDEYVIPADVVSMLGNGSSDAGADELDDFLKDVRKEAFGREEQQKEINAEKGLSSIA